MSESIYPITQLYFECSGCKTRWMIRPDPPLMSIQDFKRFMDQGGMGPCPKNCGSQTCSAAFKLPGGENADSSVDPFSIFDETKDKR